MWATEKSISSQAPLISSIEQRLAAEIAAKPAQIAAAIALLDEGATVPFISRYRKEATGGLSQGNRSFGRRIS
jgi:transcriptional accessory protein Tex/SPT6